MVESNKKYYTSLVIFIAVVVVLIFAIMYAVGLLAQRYTESPQVNESNISTISNSGPVQNISAPSVNNSSVQLANHSIFNLSEYNGTIYTYSSVRLCPLNTSMREVRCDCCPVNGSQCCMAYCFQCVVNGSVKDFYATLNSSEIPPEDLPYITFDNSGANASLGSANVTKGSVQNNSYNNSYFVDVMLNLANATLHLLNSTYNLTRNVTNSS